MHQRYLTALIALALVVSATALLVAARADREANVATSISGLHVEIDNLKDALERERQDRLNAESRSRATAKEPNP